MIIKYSEVTFHVNIELANINICTENKMQYR